MKKVVAPLLLGLFALGAHAQTPTYQDQPYGKVDIADLQMTACDFEKDANAEVLLDVGKFYYGEDLRSVIHEYHGRVKIFNANGNDKASIHISFESLNRFESIGSLEAETINLVDGKAEVTKLDKKSFFTTVIDNANSEISFTFPNVKPGSILDYKYKKTINYDAYIPTWNFQSDIPVRYSELSVSIPEVFYFRSAPQVNLPLVKHTTSVSSDVLKVTSHTVSVGGTTTSDQQSDSYPYNINNEVWGMANVPSLHTDDYTSSFADNVQSMHFYLVSFRPIGGAISDYSDTWAKVGYALWKDPLFGDQLNRSIADEKGVLAKAASLSTNDEKIAFVFDTVRNAMKWNGLDRWYTIDGPPKAWDHKSGNSTEINLIVNRLLHELNIDAFPMVVSTRSNGKANPYSTTERQFNRTVVYVPVDTAHYYVLDATGKYNVYNETPSELLNSFGLSLDRKKMTYDTLTLTRKEPVRQVVLINAEIKPGGKVEGTAQINDMSYDRISVVKRYKTDGEEKYIKYLQGGDNSLKISSIKFDNMAAETEPLTQNITFALDLAGSDENYIYLNPNVLTPFKTNPFLSDSRATDIYFGYLRNYSINSVYKIPAGYKVDALPKSVNMAAPDRSIGFKRIVAEQDGSILVHFIIDIRKRSFGAAEYPGVHDFYKKMYELLNEQIVLKKG
jgi:hypothetical protein